MNAEPSLKEIQKEWHGTLRSYLIGFIACILLTATSFYLVTDDILTGENLIYTLIGLAIIQAAVQLRFFLHLGQEAKPRWETLIFFFMILILLIIAIGSLWIMHDLNSRMMPDMTKTMTHD